MGFLFQIMSAEVWIMICLGGLIGAAIQLRRLENQVEILSKHIRDIKYGRDE
jgi:hypothetical protein